MNTPPFLLGASLLFWGYQTGMVLPALLMAVVLEAARWLKLRWDFGLKDYNRAWDFSIIFFGASAAYCFISRDTTNDLMEFFKAGNFTQRNRAMNQAVESFFILFQWWPMTLFPCALTQTYGTRDKQPFTVFSWYLRRRAAQRNETPRGGIHFGWVFFAVTLAAASVTNQRDPVFFTGLCVLAGWALWRVQPRRFSTVIWLCALALVIKLAYWGQLSLNSAQSIVERKFSGWVSALGNKPGDRLDSNTAIGQIGKLKLSGKIVMRVEVETSAPSLLRDSSFNTFVVRPGEAVWSAHKRDFFKLDPESGGNDTISHKLLTDSRATTGLTISSWMQRGRGFLAVPHGTTELENLFVDTLETNRFGVVRVFGGPSLTRFRAKFGRGTTADAPYTTNDLADLNVPTSELSVIRSVVEELGLDNLPPTDQVRAISSWFARNFIYSTYLTANAAKGTNTSSPIAYFLRTTKAGHCEYFATATVLLLRQTGIPARYANGYSLQERDKGGKKFIVRERHAHAWSLYWMDGAWHELDTTPGTWVQAEKPDASAWEAIRDFFSELWFRFNVWRQESSKGTLQRYLGALLAVVVVVLAWRLFFGKRRTRLKQDEASAGEKISWPGADSEFYLVEKKLAEQGFVRLPGETPGEWLARVRPATGADVLPRVLALHYRYRFDPSGLDAGERAALRTDALAWLEMEKVPPPHPTREL